jgi:hypothetical protein
MHKLYTGPDAAPDGARAGARVLRRRDRAGFFIPFIPPTSLYFYIRCRALRSDDFTRGVFAGSSRRKRAAEKCAVRKCVTSDLSLAMAVPVHYLI